MFVRPRIYLLIFISHFAVAPYCKAQFRWDFSRYASPCATATREVPTGADDGAGSWHWVASHEQQRHRTIGLYNQYCARCHANDGRGICDMPDIPNFADAVWQNSRTDEQLARFTWEGRGAVMPAFRGTLTWEESWSLAHYIREFARQETPRPQTFWGAPYVIAPAPPQDLWSTSREPRQPLELDMSPQSPDFESPILDSPPARNEMPAVDQRVPDTKEEPLTATDEELDEYFNEKSARPSSEVPVEETEELTPPQSGLNENGLYDNDGLRKYNLSSPLLGNPTPLSLSPANVIELQSYPTTGYPITPHQPIRKSYPVTRYPSVKPRPGSLSNKSPKGNSPGKQLFDEYSLPPGLFPPMRPPTPRP